MSRLPLRKQTAAALRRAAQELVAALSRGEDPEIGAAYKTRGIQRVLRDEMFEGCCCFCEASTEATNYGQVEHYRPKARAEFRHLAYVWENLLWACGRCNGPKSDVWNEAAPLLDPTVDDPNQHLRWNDAELQALTPRGRHTVDLLDLNGVAQLDRFERRRDYLRAAQLAFTVANDDQANEESRALAKEVFERLRGPRAPYRGMLEGNGLGP